MRASDRKLVKALEKRVQKNSRLLNILSRARAGKYNEYFGPFQYPRVVLIADLRWAGEFELAQAVIEGRFDATEEEVQEWAESPQGKELVETIRSDSFKGLFNLKERKESEDVDSLEDD